MPSAFLGAQMPSACLHCRRSCILKGVLQCLGAKMPSVFEDPVLFRVEDRYEYAWSEVRIPEGGPTFRASFKAQLTTWHWQHRTSDDNGW